MGLAAGSVVGLLVLWVVVQLLPPATSPPAAERAAPGGRRSTRVAPEERAVDQSFVRGRPLARAPAPPAQIDPPPWTAGADAGVVAAPGRDHELAMQAVLVAHDAAAADRLAAGIRAAVYGPRAAPCGVQEARRRSVAWLFNAVLAADVAIADGGATISGLHFPPDPAATAGGPEFQRCFAAAVAGAAFSCEGCRPGSITVPVPVALRPYFPDPDPSPGVQ